MAKRNRKALGRALLPWIIVCVVMLIWGNGAFKTWANSISFGIIRFPICTRNTAGAAADLVNATVAP